MKQTFKRFRRVIAILMCLAILCTMPDLAFARETHFFGEIKLVDEDYSNLEYQYHDISNCESYAAEFEAILKSDRTEENCSRIRELIGLLETEESNFVIDDYYAYIKYVSAYSEKTSEEYINSEINNNRADFLRISCLKSLGSSKYSDILLEYPDYKEYISDGEESENDDMRRLYELKNRENELIAEYNKNTFGTYIITDEQGNGYNMSSLYTALCEAWNRYQDGEISFEEYEKYEELYEKYYEESAAVLGPILIELVNTRNHIAELSGYSSYEEYAAREIYKRDYPVEYSRNLCEYVKKYIVPLYGKTKEALSSMPEVSPLTMSEEELLSLHGECVKDISDEMYAVWQKMMNNNALIVLDKDNRFFSAGSGVTVPLNSLESIQQYILLGSDPDNPVDTLNTLQHEFGHFNNWAYVPNSNHFSYDIIEINSSGLENLFTHYYDRIYGYEANAAELMALKGYLNMIVFYACLDEFQHIIYSEPGLTVEKLNDIYVRVNNEYGYALSSEDIYDKTSWMLQNHLYPQPFYAMSYVTSYTATLELWGEKEEDFYAAADKYLRFAALEENEGVIKMLEKGGYGNVFEEDTVRKTAESIDRMMGYGIWTDGGTDTAEVDGFVDIADDAYYRDVVNWAFSNTITLGTDEAHFSPSDITTRAQMMTFLWRAAGSSEPEHRSLPFSDVREDSYYYKAVLWAAEKGIVSGISENKFAPDTAITRAQAVTFLYRYEGMDTMEIKDNPFSDVADGQYYTDAVLWANARNITNGTSEAEFSPDAECLRAQIVTFLYRYFGQN